MIITITTLTLIIITEAAGIRLTITTGAGIRITILTMEVILSPPTQKHTLPRQAVRSRLTRPATVVVAAVATVLISITRQVVQVRTPLPAGITTAIQIL